MLHGELRQQGDYYAQTKVSLEIIGKALGKAGASLEDVIPHPDLYKRPYDSLGRSR